MLLIPKRHRQTDGQTDGRLTVALPRSALASRGKETMKTMTNSYQQQTTTKNEKVTSYNKRSKLALKQYSNSSTADRQPSCDYTPLYWTVWTTTGPPHGTTCCLLIVCWRPIPGYTNTAASIARQLLASLVNDTLFWHITCNLVTEQRRCTNNL